MSPHIGWRRRATAIVAVALVGWAAAGCASRGDERRARIAEVISGEWQSAKGASDRSGWKRALSVVDGRSAPQPTTLVIHADGRFEATYEPADHRMFARIVGGELGNPVEGTWTMRLDLTGTPWVSFEPGAPERRLTLDKGKLTLHAVDMLWAPESFVRPPRGG